MEVQVQAKGVPGAQAFRARMTQRIREVLGQLARMVNSITVRLSDDRGARLGADKICRTVVKMRDNSSLVIEEFGDDMLRLIDVVVARTYRSVCSQLLKSPAAGSMLTSA